jgi:tetratricopeptide (TPR) repeat protein
VRTVTCDAQRLVGKWLISIVLASGLLFVSPASALRAATCGPGTRLVRLTTGPTCIALNASTTTTTPDVSRLDQRLTDTSSELHDFIIIFGVLLAIGFGTSFFSWWTTTRRESRLAIASETSAQARAAEAHQRFVQQADLALEAQTSAGARVSQQFEQARETLDLVNEALQLANQATDRANRAIEDKALKERKSLDVRARALIAAVRHRDETYLITDPHLRERMTALAERIAVFENTQFLLPSEVRLTPACRFLAAMAAHLKGQFEEAFTAWDAVALDEQSPSDLRSSARYWTGYERNNLGHFEQAADSFSLALDDLSNDRGALSRRYDIRRIIIETRFFGDLDDPGNLLEMADSLLAELHFEQPSEDLPDIMARVASTAGNIAHILGVTAKDQAQASQFFARAVDYFGEFADVSPWARFGLAEALWCSQERRAEGIALFRSKIRDDAKAEFDQREEFRSKFRAKSCELICCLRVPEFGGDVDSISRETLSALGRVEERLTVYSLVRRKNVSQDEMREHDLPALLERSA